MITIVFWNIAKNRAALPHLKCLTGHYDVDVFVLAEIPKRTNLVETAKMLGVDKGSFRNVENVRGKTVALSRLDARRFQHKFTGINGYLSAWSLKSARFYPNDVLIAGVHLRSKSGGLSGADQSDYAKPIVEELGLWEDRLGHNNTIFVGDFNMHPYDHGMTSWAVIHGLMTTALASKTGQKNEAIQNRRFYNPMWGLFGDRSPGAAGTFYWRSSAPHNPHWAIVDQILVRPSMIPTLAELTILASDGDHSLTKKDGTPDRSYLSDHLPVMARFDL